MTMYKRTPLDQFSLAHFSSAKHPSPFHSVFCPLAVLAQTHSLSVTGCVEVKNVGSDSDSGVYTPEEHFPKLSPRSAPLGIGEWIIKNLFFVQACRSREPGWDGEAVVGILERNP